MRYESRFQLQGYKDAFKWLKISFQIPLFSNSSSISALSPFLGLPWGQQDYISTFQE